MEEAHTYQDLAVKLKIISSLTKNLKKELSQVIDKETDSVII